MNKNKFNIIIKWKKMIYRMGCVVFHLFYLSSAYSLNKVSVGSNAPNKLQEEFPYEFYYNRLKPEEKSLVDLKNVSASEKLAFSRALWHLYFTSKNYGLNDYLRSVFSEAKRVPGSFLDDYFQSATNTF